jgi:glycine dehydrogenase subunit 1
VKGVKVLTKNFFNEFTVELPKKSKDVVDKLAGQGIIAGYPLDGNQLLLAATEMTTDNDIKALCDALTKVLA